MGSGCSVLEGRGQARLVSDASWQRPRIPPKQRRGCHGMAGSRHWPRNLEVRPHPPTSGLCQDPPLTLQSLPPHTSTSGDPLPGSPWYI